MNTGVHVSFQITVFVFSRYIPRSRITDSYGRSIFGFWKNLHAVFHSGCINLHSHQWYMRVPFSPHPLQRLLSVDFLMKAFLTGVDDTSLWFWFAFLWWLAMLSIFSCAYWPSVCLWKNVYLGLLPIFQLGWFFWYWVVWAVCIFWILTPCQSHSLQIFSPIL